MTPFYIQIAPSYTLILDKLFENIIDKIRSSKSSDIPWELIKFENPERGMHDIKTFIKFKTKIFKNLGYLEIVKYKDHLRVIFIQNKYGVKSSFKHIAFLFLEFIDFIKTNFGNLLGNISILDYYSIFLQQSYHSFPYIHLYTHRCHLVSDCVKALYKHVYSSRSPWVTLGYLKDFEIIFKSSSDNIQIYLRPRNENNPDYLLSIPVILLLISHHFHTHAGNYTEGITFFP